ncbi:MAG TPA: hypothetical protein VL463_00020 [Kofleriaceae bacterium]|nr:hypothetical protein [Kofleriaceae bacterium]
MKRALLSILFVAACGKGGSSDKPAPAKPPTGAPVAVEGTISGKDSVDVDVYNFADKPTALYDFMFRYHDKDGKVMKVKAGTPFESTIDRMSMSGRHFMCDPAHWCHFKVDMLNPPDGAKTVDALVDRVGSTDGTKIDDLWKLESTGGMDEWPVK